MSHNHWSPLLSICKSVSEFRRKSIKAWLCSKDYVRLGSSKQNLSIRKKNIHLRSDSKIELEHSPPWKLTQIEHITSVWISCNLQWSLDQITNNLLCEELDITKNLVDIPSASRKWNLCIFRQCKFCCLFVFFFVLY